MSDGFDQVDDPRPEITMMGDKIFYGNKHVASVVPGVPESLAEDFSIELLNGVKAAENVADLFGYYRAIRDIAHFKGPAINHLKDTLGSKVAAFILPRGRK